MQFPTTTSRKSLEYAASRVNGGRDMFVEYVRMGSKDNPEVIPFLELWDSQSPTTRSRSTFDQFAHLANVPADRVLSVAAGAAFRYNADISDMMAMASMPEVVKASIVSAKKQLKHSHKDRELLMKHSRFVPVPSGSTINIANMNQAASSASANAGLPDFSQSVLSTADAVRDAWKPEEE